MLLNKAHAFDIMDKYNLDGLIAVTARNVYYLTDHASFSNRTKKVFYEYAVLPRAEDAPAALIISAPELPWLADDPTWVSNVVSYTHAVPPAGVPLTWPRREGSDLPPREQQWLAIEEKYRDRICSTPFHALKRALRDAELEKATVGCDDPRVVTWLNDLGLEDLKGVEATNIFREIRVIKSEEEIAVMRQAARVNENGLNAGLGAIHKGSTWNDVERAYFTEVVQQGGHGVYITPGPGGLSHDTMVPGQPIMVDALGQFRFYHGDLGRTAIIGEPTKEMRSRNRAMAAGWERAFEMIKPGVTGSTLIEAVLDTIRGEGFPEFHLVVPHSVGLEHTDHPVPIGPEMAESLGEFVFRENMTVNVDLPYHEFGWGAMHLEDTIVVTADGCEALTSEATDLFVIP
jgi:Xaa-Pro dipeptidase